MLRIGESPIYFSQTQKIKYLVFFFYNSYINNSFILMPLLLGIWEGVIQFYSCPSVRPYVCSNISIWFPLEQIILNLYTRSDTIKGRPSLISDFVTFSVLE